METRIYKTKELTAEALADELFARISGHKGLLSIALSGGSTPSLLFSTLAEKYGQRIDWQSVKIFWVDERMVSPRDDQSNYKMTAMTLLDRIPIPESNIYRVRGEDNAEDEVIRYSRIIRESLPEEKGYPIFDIILLGIGDDGHTASIFPDQMALLQSDKVCEIAVHPTSGQKRITLTGTVINKGKSVIFLSCGKSKAEILKKIRQGDVTLPASHIHNRGELLLYADADAASE